MSMESPKLPLHTAYLLDDLESIRDLLEDEDLQPPLLTAHLEADTDIPLLSEVIAPARENLAENPLPAASEEIRPVELPEIFEDSEDEAPQPAQVSTTLLRREAELILQDVLDDFVPQIEAELKRRLDARLDQLLAPRKG